MIARLWRWLFCGCQHKWIVYRECKFYSDGAAPDAHPRAVSLVLQCERCGNIKTELVA